MVQGVGFRPFICRLAVKHGLLGEVDNRTNGVSVILQGDIRTVERFTNDILENAPPASQIKSIELIPKQVEEFTGFRIAGSKAADNQITEVSPDIAVCDECLADMSADPARIDYPFINCTNCGPRFTIIKGLPYDRTQTTMKDFRMCEKCSKEYNDILDRRFHAQPVACNNCGPEYLFRDNERNVTGTFNILKEIVSEIESGKIIAIKGTGGYHLMCDALNNDSVKRLRKRKHRDEKPFAVMFRDITEIKNYCHVDEAEQKELLSYRRPIVILRQKTPLAEEVSSGLKSIGAMLPYMPFHYLLFRHLNIPAFVLTSGNLSDEPTIIEDSEAEKKLMSVADSLVSYNRKIHNRADDSVIRIISGKTSLIRRSRGYVPRPVDLNFNVEGILALGAEQKNSFCLGRNFQAIMSQYIGDLKNAATYDFFGESIDRFSTLFRFRPKVIACDMHPDYFSTEFASKLGQSLGIPVVRVQHHHAHIVSCMAEYGLDDRVIGISMDGTGYGTDGNIWGSEFMIADTRHFERVAHFDYVPMPGGDAAADEPWRMAFSFLFKYFGDSIDYQSLPAFRPVNYEVLNIVREMIRKNINCPVTSGAGRLFDAVSALAGLCTVAGFDSEAPMRLESAIETTTDLSYPYNIDKTISFRETFLSILSDLEVQDISLISAKFHNTIAQVILDVAERIRKEYSLNKVVLSGGVFQNKYLLERTVRKLRQSRFMVFTNHLVPSNDGGISLGQLVVASKTPGLCA